MDKDVYDLLRLLWIHGCDLSARDSHGRTPTQLAIFLTELMSLDIFSIWEEALRRLGVDVNALIRNEDLIVHIGITSAAETKNSKAPVCDLRHRRRKSKEMDLNETRLFDEEQICECMSCITKNTVFTIHPKIYLRIQDHNKLDWRG